MVHSVESILGYLHDWYEPSPGDLVWTGTPEGVGPMHEGDVVECWMKNSDGETVSVFNAECVV
jgi:fumarylpyruvate hydrolase